MVKYLIGGIVVLFTILSIDWPNSPHTGTWAERPVLGKAGGPVSQQNQSANGAVQRKNIPVDLLPEMDVRKVYVCRADIASGLIGTTMGEPVDEAYDNVFHINIPQGILTGATGAYLTYEVFGVADQNSLARSINDGQALGGRFVRRGNVWSAQKEALPVQSLKDGRNTVRFGLPDGARFYYRVKGVALTVEKGGVARSAIAMATPTCPVYGGKAYIKGILQLTDATNSKDIELTCNGISFQVLDGGFEAILPVSENDRTVEVKAVLPDGKTLLRTVALERGQKPDQEFALGERGIAVTKACEQGKKFSLRLDGGKGASVDIGPNLLNDGTKISLIALRDVDIAPLNIDMVNVTKGSVAYRVLPKGASLKGIAKVSIPYDTTLIPEGYTAKDIKSYCFDEDRREWIELALDTLLAENNVTVSGTDRFNDMINGIIKVPESPQTQGYAPTTIKDIKPANPSVGIESIDVPRANSNGSVVLDFPFKLPKGRQGMQPRLNAQYNSDAGNGWMGLGWNVAVPSIGLDTRWGVPRYDPALETETYTLNGEQLAPYTDKAAFKPRAAEKQFYPRVEGSFNRIIRHGNHPNNYWWEVTDKTGTRSFYGGTPSQGLFTNALLRDDNGNIAQWGLVETLDLNGNTVNYNYVTVSDVGLAGGSVPGRQLYINQIFYTGYAGKPGPYRIDFFRDRQFNEPKRQDVSISARMGFKMVTADLLRKVTISYNNQPIRSYDFEYTTGAFYKTLLRAVSELDNLGQLFYKHEFKYFDDVNAAGGYTPYAAAENWSPVPDGLAGDISNPIPGFTGEATALGTSKSKNSSRSLALTLGIWNYKRDKSLTVGGSFGSGSAKTEGLVALVDITGDNLPDKVFKKNGQLQYRANLGGAAQGFGPLRPIVGINNIGASNSRTSTRGVEVNASFAFWGYTRSNTTTTTEVFFNDYNGDGLIDISNNGIVYYNRIVAGNPVFLPSSAQTPSPILQGSNVTTQFLAPDTALQAQQERDYPLQDAIRVWEAPFTGNVSINAPVQLVNTGIPASPKHDGVRVSIQVSSLPVWGTNIAANDFAVKLPTGVNNISVAKGDKVYFRVQSVYNGEADLVNWDPIIQYTNSVVPPLDANARPSNYYRASEDFVLSNTQGIDLPKDGTIKIDGNFIKGVTSDTVTVQVIKESGGISVVVLQQVFACSTLANQPVSVPSLAVLAGDNLRFVLASDSYIDRAKLQWQPHYEYIAFTDATPVTAPSGAPTIEGYTAPDNTNFNHWADSVRPLANPQTDTVSIKPLLSALPSANGPVTFTVKRTDQIVGKIKLNVVNGTVAGAGDSIRVIRSANDVLYCDYHAVGDTLAALLQSARIVVAKDSSYIDGSGNTVSVIKRDTVGANLYANPSAEYLGTLFRGWGLFSFKGDPTNGPLDETKINADSLQNYSTNPNLFTDSSLFNGIIDASRTEFIPMYSDIRKKQWLGFDSAVFVSAAQMGSARLWVYDVSVDSLMGGGIVTSVNKVTDTKSSSYALGLSTVFGSASASYSKTKTVNLLDVQDMNGDRHPDVLHVNNIQYTLPSGGLETGFRTHNLNASVFEGESRGVSLGGPIPTGFAKNVLSIVSANVANNAAATIGLSGSGSYGNNDDETPALWIDMNNDGLPEKVYSNGLASLNLGYKFAAPEPWGIVDIEKNKSDERGAGISFGVNRVNGSFQVGFSLQRSDGAASTSFVDLNGDMLVDKIWRNGNVISVQLNKGNGFGPVISWNGLTDIRKTSSTGESFNGAFTIAIRIPIFLFLDLKFCINPSYANGNGVSKEQFQISDISGDDYADMLQSSNDGNLTVRRSTIGRTNLLRSVSRPMNSGFNIDYERLGNTYDMPQSKWVMKSVELFDGVPGDGVDTMRSQFAYAGGYYDRNEREFYGFDSVVTHELNTASGNTVYRSSVQTFLNRTLYTKGLLKSEWLQNAAGGRYTQTNNFYDIRPVLDSVNFPALVKTDRLFYEGAAAPGIRTTTAYDYDPFGNVTKINDAGDGSQQDVLLATVTYHNNNALYIKSIPSTIVVNTAGGLIRRRETSIDQNGDITQIRQYLTNDSVAIYDMEYDGYGNLAKITRPHNYKQQRLWYAYEYDNQVNTYVTKVKDAYGYSSSSTYEYLFGQLTGTVSMQGQPMRYIVDNRGRTVAITGPYEIAAGKPYTIAFEYYPGAAVPYAITHHHDPEYNADINTVTFMDGLERPLQVKKQAALFRAKNQPNDIKMIVTGKVIYDAFGRPVVNYYPTTEPLGALNLVLSPATGGLMATNSYDVMDRNVSVQLADGSLSSNAYTITNGLFSQFEKDPLNNTRETLTDVKGRKRTVNVFGGPNGTIATRYQYNAMSELLRVVDVGNNAIGYTYDRLGRQTSITHPDAGHTAMAYDLAGNLLSKVTPQIRQEIPIGGAIKYYYDHERVTDIDYPRHYQNKVKYSYGAPGSGNRTGRLVLQQDASGGQEFYYGRLGEITKTIRTMMVNSVFYTTYVSEQEYDTWNRLKKMVYPDGEVVKYFYNRGGSLDSITGQKIGHTYAYVKQLGLDEFEQRVYLQYGNGTENYYTYDNLRRRLVNLKSATDTGRVFMDNAYTYDAVSNVLSLVNNAQPVAGLLGGSSRHDYTYDNLYRLTSAKGDLRGAGGDTANYKLDMAYDNLYNILRKDMRQTKANGTYNNAYAYQATGPHQPSKIGTDTCRYDLNGNLLQRGGRQYFWDEENRLAVAIQDGKLSQYTYDADGERAVKSSGGIRGIWVNGAPGGIVNHDTDYTAYVSPYLVCRRTSFTKHYYIEGQRIATKVGIGRFTNISFPQSALTAGGINYLQRMAQIERDRYAYYVSRGVSPGPPTDKYFWVKPENSGIAAPITYDTTSGVPVGWPGNITPPPTGPPIFVSPIPSNDSVQAGYGFTDPGHFAELNQYFYHPDHLGSTAFVTNVLGEVCQHQEYTAYGETFFDRHTGSREMPYLFNAKERDAETGLYYYGARYYDPRTSVWVSVDPLMDEPSQIEKSPYAYVWNNPVKYTDPDGRILETGWDALNVAIGIASFTANIKQGNFIAAAVDAVGVAVDAAATVAPGIPGGAGTAIRAARGADKAVDIVKGVDRVSDLNKLARTTKTTEKTVETSRAARRQAMRDEGIPTSQQPRSQSKSESGREYLYDVPKSGGGRQTKSVQQQTKDRSHQSEPHWEAGKVKTDTNTGEIRRNQYGTPKLTNDKSKVYYNVRQTSD